MVIHSRFSRFLVVFSCLAAVFAGGCGRNEKARTYQEVVISPEEEKTAAFTGDPRAFLHDRPAGGGGDRQDMPGPLDKP